MNVIHWLSQIYCKYCENYRTNLSCHGTASASELKYSHHLFLKSIARLECRLLPWWASLTIPIDSSRYWLIRNVHVSSSSSSSISLGVYINLPTILLRSRLWRQQQDRIIVVATWGSYLNGARKILKRAPITPKAFSERNNLKEKNNL